QRQGGRSQGRPAGAGRETHRRGVSGSAGPATGSGAGRRRGRGGRAVRGRGGLGSRGGRGGRGGEGGRGARGGGPGGRGVGVGGGVAELVDELAEGVVGVAETLGGLLLGQALDEDGAEGLVLALGGAGWFAEEEPAGGVVHARGTQCEVIVNADGLQSRRSP